MPDTPPIGRRFSQVYLQRGEPTHDSDRMRRRLAALVLSFSDLKKIERVVPLKLGIDVPYHAYGPNWPVFFGSCSLQDVLDFVTVAYEYLYAQSNTGFHKIGRWCTEVQAIFEEENVHYGVDQQGGVHFRYDAEFEANRAATITALQGARYRAALTAFEAGMAALGKAPPDGKTAIREAFGAAEALFRLMFPKSPRLTAAEMQKLEPLVQRVNTGEKVATAATVNLLNAYKDWTNAAHFYRHEHGQEEPMQPPLALAIQMVSIGASFIRWLAELDAADQNA